MPYITEGELARIEQESARGIRNMKFLCGLMLIAIVIAAVVVVLSVAEKS